MALQEQHYYQTPGHVVAAGILLSLVAIIAVAVRFTTRTKEKQPLKADDWLLLPATMLTAGVGSCLVYGVSQEAFGYREYLTSVENPSETALQQMSTSIKLEWSISLILPVALACTKASFVFFYKRIFSISRIANWLLNALVIFLTMWAVAFFLATLLCCKVMLIFIWKPISEMSQCKFFLQILMAFCITGFVTDLVIIGVPLPLIWRLKLSRGQKILASLLFLLGAVTVAAALARLVVTVGFFKQASDPNNDNILNITLYVYWGMVECSMAVFAACLPTFRLFSQRWTWSEFGGRARRIFCNPSSGRFYPDSRNQNGIHIERMAGVESNEKRKYANLDNSPSISHGSSNIARVYAAEAPETVRDTV
ncbi:hypothetical protein F5X99DRAFT_427139 [Biscogniauxia marginata]|nr:hypothetical protein F5X99DRAFT_427139 [Biscogniauxia marginata]